jgi:hypothetical protein
MYCQLEGIDVTEKSAADTILLDKTIVKIYTLFTLCSKCYFEFVLVIEYFLFDRSA